ncbi:MAG: FtsX-like permease family protein [Planctomycetales bacterium]|nr:FtsX-like permease family protein [Planctomycetales bacterium]
MKLKTKTPLAWKNLTHDWRRLAAALAGIGFAVLLMFTQVGFQNALFDSQVKIIDDLQGDIFLVSKAKYTLAAEKRFPIARINQARSCSGVSGAYPLYSELTTSVLRTMDRGKGNRGYPLRSIGFYLDDPVFRLAGIKSQINKLRPPGTALIDRKSKAKKFNVPQADDAGLARRDLELANKKVTLVGTFDLGTDFAHDGNLVMNAENFAKYFPHRKRFGDPLSVVDIGIVHVQQGFTPDSVKQVLQKTLESDVHILTREEFRTKEITFWDKSTPIGTIFFAGKVIGFVVGMVICYQVIYSDIAEHMPEFATLKAMGYTTGFFIRLIFIEALLLSIIGFIPGAIISRIIYGVLGDQTGLLMLMTPMVIVFVFTTTVAMCVASGLLAVRKLLAADPASLF